MKKGGKQCPNMWNPDNFYLHFFLLHWFLPFFGGLFLLFFDVIIHCYVALCCIASWCSFTFCVDVPSRCWSHLYYIDSCFVVLLIDVFSHCLWLFHCVVFLCFALLVFPLSCWLVFFHFVYGCSITLIIISSIMLLVVAPLHC